LDPANPTRLVLPNRLYIPRLCYYSAQRDHTLQWHKEPSGKCNTPPHLTLNFLSFLDCNSDNKNGATSMSGYNLSTPPISSAHTKELIGKDADPVLQFLMQQIAQLVPHDLLQTIYINKIESAARMSQTGFSSMYCPAGTSGNCLCVSQTMYNVDSPTPMSIVDQLVNRLFGTCQTMSNHLHFLLHLYAPLLQSLQPPLLPQLLCSCQCLHLSVHHLCLPLSSL
jgi:hypothetical protein